MCSYNRVNGAPSCASSYLLQDILREHWGWTDDNQYIVSDCDAVADIFETHNDTSTPEIAVANALNAGTDLDCGTYFADHLPAAFNQSLFEEATLDQALTRLYSSLIRLGYFDPPENQVYRALGQSDINTPASQELARDAAVQGIVLLKNDGTLPFSKNSSIALIGPWANATTQMQSNYFGVAPFLHSPLIAAQSMGLEVTYAPGTAISTSDTSQFAAAISAAESSDIIVFAGGIDNTVEAESRDRVNITWPGNQLDLIQQLSALGKPLIVLQMGGGQVDDSALVNNVNVSSLVWGGYPGQDGGTALMDILVGNAAPAGRLPVTQYPASYVDEIAMTNMALRPSNSSTGRTYKWYTGTPVFEFGFGVHYTNFSKTLTLSTPDSLTLAGSTNHTATAVTTTAAITNSGNVTSDYVALVFMTTTNAGPAPFPKKTLVGYQRLGAIAPGETRSAAFDLTYERFSRVDVQGNSMLYPGDFVLSLDVDGEAQAAFTMTGSSVMIDEWPQPS